MKSTNLELVSIKEIICEYKEHITKLSLEIEENSSNYRAKVDALRQQYE